MNELKKCMYQHVVGLYHIAYEVKLLHNQSNIEKLNGIIWTLKRIYGFSSTEIEMLDVLLEIRKETMMDDGWINYTK